MKGMGRFPSSFGLFLVICLLSGCSGAMSDVIVPISLGSPANIGNGQTLPANIEAFDLRRDSTMRRTAFNASLGAISLAPPESELVKQLVANALQRIDGERDRWGEPLTIYCGIKTFDIVTPSTPLYWDVTTRIELILRVRGNERAVTGESVERTWIYPSEEIIRRVTTKALHDVFVAIEQALPILLAKTP